MGTEFLLVERYKILGPISARSHAWREKDNLPKMGVNELRLLIKLL